MCFFCSDDNNKQTATTKSHTLLQFQWLSLNLVFRPAIWQYHRAHANTPWEFRWHRKPYISVTGLTEASIQVQQVFWPRTHTISSIKRTEEGTLNTKAHCLVFAKKYEVFSKRRWDSAGFTHKIIWAFKINQKVCTQSLIKAIVDLSFVWCLKRNFTNMRRKILPSPGKFRP